MALYDRDPGRDSYAVIRFGHGWPARGAPVTADAMLARLAGPDRARARFAKLPFAEAAELGAAFLRLRKEVREEVAGATGQLKKVPNSQPNRLSCPPTPGISCKSSSFTPASIACATSAAKAALEAYVRQLAVELAPRGVAVNAIRAGVTETAALEKIPGAEDLKRTATALNPHARLTEPGDVARFVRLLLDPAADWVTGNVLGVDGGEDIAAP